MGNESHYSIFFSIEFKIQIGGKNNGKIICVRNINEGAKSS